MKQALEVAKSGSINKAAEVLLVAAPNISRSIKELESDLGITIFERTQNGMKLTPDGEEFLDFAKSIVGQIDRVENYYKKGHPRKQTFSLSAPRASYVCEAFAEFSKLDNASFYGRIFARSGGLSDAVAQGLKEQNIEFDLKSIPCDGIEACKAALLRKQKNVLDANFIEGMACVGGCIGGAGCLTHGEKNKAQVDEYGREAMEKTIGDAISLLK